MSGATTELNLATAVDSDDNADYLTLSLANSLRTVDALFNNVSGHNHGGAHQGGPVAPAAGSITSGMIADGTIATADLADASVTNAKLASDTARANLLTNGGFEIWQRGNGPFTASGTYTADRWLMQVAAGSGTLAVTKETTTVDVRGLTSAKVVYTAGAGDSAVGFYQPYGNVAEASFIRGTPLSLSIRVNASSAGRIRPWWYDAVTGGGTRQYGAYNVSSGIWETLTQTFTPSSTATTLLFGLEFLAGTSATVYVDNAMLVVGSQAADYAPLHPADDLHRCQRYYELIGAVAGGAPAILGYAGVAGETWGTTLFYKANKPVTPTLTKLSLFSAVNCSQAVVDQPSKDSCRLLTTAVAIGAFGTNADVAGIAVEANP